MRKILLSSILTSVFIAPAFCAFPVNDSNNDGELDGAELAQTSQQRTVHNIGSSVDSHTKTKVKKGDEDLHTNVMGMHRKHQKNNTKSYDAPSGKITHHEADYKKAKKDNSEDDNPNLANLTTPEVNVRNNLAVSDQDVALSRQMMLNGPQGGIQNNQPPGIGGTSANF
ncbi:hypothetical protein [Francisella uliginis]|uniref:EF-hand domain-containing protein n=1 Tax=Francisella uliginis TaxID=573570 RepID=A0A1L4BSU3_9GAMM|nr:hypothetical protein [Francisella uliginis]API86921.1 hypothetical protein F7310_05925 [Francisella uliginis]